MDIVMQNWIWRNFRFNLPEDWEMLQFSRNPQEGRCAFADRYQFRFELNWRKVPAAPDFSRVMSDYMAKLSTQENSKKPRRISAKNWHGIEVEVEGILSSRFGRFFGGQSYMVELVFLWPEKKQETLVEQVLSSFEELEQHEGFHRWRAFGMDLLATADLTFGKCKAEPASVEMIFADKASRREERFSRRGMVAQWLDGPVGTWLRSRFPEAKPVAPEIVMSHNIEKISFERRARGASRLIGAREKVEAAAWICPEDERLYSICLVHPSREEGAINKLAGGRLSCCRKLEITE